MKYYIGQLVLNDHASDREYNRHVCVVAANEAAAQRELEAFAAEWDSDGERDSSGGWRYGDDDRSYTVFAYSLREVSAATFDEMAEVLTPLGDVAKVSLEDKEPAQAVKAVCHRISEQLGKQGVSVAATKLLQAVSAALGATGWAQLKARVQTPAAPVSTVQMLAEAGMILERAVSTFEDVLTDIEDWEDKALAEAVAASRDGLMTLMVRDRQALSTRSSLPRGNPNQEPLRKAADLDFAARVDAIWLADGDVALAARLLHVGGEDLLNTFETAGDADVAFCGRPAHWRPEHSLARDYGILADARFEVVTEHLYVGHTQVQGWFAGHDAIGFNDHIGGNWHLTGITAPTGPLDEVRHQLACYYETLRRAVEMRRRTPPATTA